NSLSLTVSFFFIASYIVNFSLKRMSNGSNPKRYIFCNIGSLKPNCFKKNSSLFIYLLINITSFVESCCILVKIIKQVYSSILFIILILYFNYYYIINEDFICFISIP